MADQDTAPSTDKEPAKTGADTGDAQKTEKTSYTADELQREADRRVTAAQKKWQEEQAALIADKTKDAETKLQELARKAEEAERYAGFIEAVTSQGVRNVKAAYTVAVHNGYIDSRGNLKLKEFRADNPEFFSPPANANAGAGAGKTGPSGGMNEWIRAAAGRT